MLARLRHDAVVGGDDQQREIDPARARQHGVDQPFMPRHVDEAGDGPAAQIGIGEAEIERDAASLLRGQPIGIDAGQRFDQRGLAVIDVAGGPDDHGAVDSNSRVVGWADGGSPTSVAATYVLELILPHNLADNKTRIGLIFFPFCLRIYFVIRSTSATLDLSDPENIF